MSEDDTIINEKLVNLNLSSQTKEGSIRELSELLFSEGKISSVNGFIEAVSKRESSMSTYCGFEVAIPHAVSPHVKEAAFAFGRTTGFSWGNEDGIVKFIFLLAIPEVTNENKSASEHINMMSAVAQLALNENVRRRWNQAKTKEDILASFDQSLTNEEL